MSKASSSSSEPSNRAGPSHHVREILTAESDEAAECLAHAFAVDEVAMYFIDTDDTKNWSHQEKWDMHVRIMRSIVKAHCQRGLALTIGPNHDCVALCKLWMLNDKLSVEGQHRFKEEFLPLLHRTKEEVLGDLDNDSWYLVYIGTKPESRGKGYARKMIEHVTNQADDQGRVCYLESSNGANPPLYRKHGFETKKTIYLTRGPQPVGMEIMVRQPLQKGSSQKLPEDHRNRL
ncbi:MAG: hypothetical protein Q9221_005045 [Calogaya cf. arnoldii]